MVIYETIEEWVSTSGLDLKVLFDPVNKILYLERADGTYESSELTPSERSGYSAPLTNIEELISNGFWPVAPSVKYGEATGSNTNYASLENPVLSGNARDNNGNIIVHAEALFDINYSVIAISTFDSSSGNYDITLKAVALADHTSDAEQVITSVLSGASVTWSDIDFGQWDEKLSVTVKGKGLVSITIGDASNVTSTEGDLKVDNNQLVLEGNAPVL